MRSKIGWSIAAALALVLGSMVVIPGFLGGRARGRASSDLRRLESAIDRYHAERGSYPPMRSMQDFVQNYEPENMPGAEEIMTLEPGSGGLAGITTPVAYLPELLNDAFAPQPYAYWTDGKKYLVSSTGADGKNRLRRPPSTTFEIGDDLFLTGPRE